MPHWSKQKEKFSSLLGIKLLFFFYQKLGFNRFRLFLHIVVVFIYFFSPKFKRISAHYFGLLAKKTGEKYKKRQTYFHFYSFAYSLLEKLAGWNGDIRNANLLYSKTDIELLVDDIMQKKGVVIVCSHLGNSELLRALGQMEIGPALNNFAINSIVDFSGTSKFNKMLSEINPSSMIRLFSASNMGADTIIQIKDLLSQGQMLVIAGDRTSKNSPQKAVETSFMGEPAWFPQGSFLLASLLESPVYYMFATRKTDLDFKSQYEFYVHKSHIDIGGSRKDRQIKIANMVKEFVGHLENLCIKHPYQWYNFFDFWKKPR